MRQECHAPRAVREVLDTNVVGSGVFFGGVPGNILSAWSVGAFVLVLAPAILEEHRRAGHELGLRYPAVSADADDDMFLAVACAAEAAVVVSGDQDLLEVTGWGGVDELTPR